VFFASASALALGAGSLGWREHAGHDGQQQFLLQTVPAAVMPVPYCSCQNPAT